MQIILVGINHKTAPVELREKLSFPEGKLGSSLLELNSKNSIRESLILSTCNRTEIYAHASNEEEGVRDIIDFLCSAHNLIKEDFTAHLYRMEGELAVKHIFSVAGGIDSMILGEGQVLGQVKSAFAACQEAGTSGPVLNKLFSTAIKTGKRARSETAISQGASSVSFAAVELAKKIFGSLSGHQVLLVGAGKMSELTLKLLFDAGIKFAIVANRTFDRACTLAENYGGKAIQFDEIQEYLKKVDIVISSTGAPHYILTREKIMPIMRMRKDKPLFIIDIAVPRDVEPAVNDIDDVYLYDIDDLSNVVEDNLKVRTKEVEKVKRIIEEEASEFIHFFNTVEVIPVLKELRKTFDDISLNQMEQIVSKNSCTEEEKQRLESFRRTLVQKLLHQPMVKIKSMAQEKDSHLYMKTITELFDLKEAEEPVEESHEGG